MNLKILVLTVFTAVYLYHLFLAWFRLQSAKNPVPENVSDVYDRTAYQKWRSYHEEKARFEICTSSVSFAVDFLLLITNAYSAFAGLFPGTYVMQMLAVMLLSAVSSLVMIPFDWHNTMVIEEKYGFNKSTSKTFWADQLKEFLIGLAVMVIIGMLLIWIHLALGDWLIPVFAVLMTSLALIISFLYPVLSRIFNKFRPLEDEYLKGRITELLEKNGYRVQAIKVMDASRRTTKSNAYFSGFGKMKTIVLYDTLVESMTPDEICAVFAHEMGHGIHRDTLKNQILSFVQLTVLGILAWLTLRSPGLFAAFGFSGVNYGFAIILMMSVEFAFLSPLSVLVLNWFSRKAEFRADQQAVREGYGPALISALKKLARQNYADLAPSPLLVKLEYSHPTLSQRIAAIEAASQ